MSESNIFLKTNNPGNIRFSKANNWKGQTGQYKGFVSFSHVDYGLRALILLIKNYIRKGYDTPEAIIYRFAPPTENETEIYLKYVHRCLPFGFDSADSTDIFHLVSAICMFETGYKFYFSYFEYVCKKFSITF